MSEQSFNVAIAGATGAVGEALIEILEERSFPVGELFLLLVGDPLEDHRVEFFNGRGRHIQCLELAAHPQLRGLAATHQEVRCLVLHRGLEVFVELGVRQRLVACLVNIKMHDR